MGAAGGSAAGGRQRAYCWGIKTRQATTAALWDPLESVGPGALVTKRLDQRHQFIRPLGVALGVGHQVFHRHRRFEDYARGKPHLMPSRLRLVCPLLDQYSILQ